MEIAYGRYIDGWPPERSQRPRKKTHILLVKCFTIPGRRLGKHLKNPAILNFKLY